MKKGELVFCYHSSEEKQVVGLARVIKEAYPDPRANAGAWCYVDFVPVKPLAKPISLTTIKADKVLREMVFVKQSRLSVSPATKVQIERLLELAEARS